LAGDALERAMRPNGVLLIDSGGFVSGAMLGGFVAYSLQQRGCVGIVTDGAIRDADEIRGLKLPVIAAAVTPVNGARRWQWTDVHTTICLPGSDGRSLAIEPDDFVLADGDGVVVVPHAVAEKVIADAEALAAIEQKIGRELREGGSRGEVFKRNPRFEHISKVDAQGAE
jgi:regulator of RNase E activity RraA